MLDAEELLGIAAGRRAGAVRRARDPLAGRRPIRARRVQAALRHPARVRLGHDLRLPGRRARQQRHPLQRGGPEGRPVHPAVQPERHAAAVRAEHHRLHGGHAVRAGRHHQARQPAHQRRVELDRAPPHPDGRGVLRRRQLRHVRSGVRPPVRVHLAEPPHRGDGPQAAGRRDVDRAAGRRPSGPGGTTTSRPTPRCARPSRPRSTPSRPRCSPPGGSGTTASSTLATPARCWASPCPPCTARRSRAAQSFGVFRL